MEKRHRVPQESEMNSYNELLILYQRIAKSISSPLSLVKLKLNTAIEMSLQETTSKSSKSLWQQAQEEILKV